jgi:hypothetical protein
VSGKDAYRARSFRLHAPGFLKQSPAPEKPGGCLNANAPALCNYGDFSGRDRNNAAGNSELSAQFPHKYCVPPAFRRRSYAVFNVQAGKGKGRPSGAAHNNGQRSQHGG